MGAQTAVKWFAVAVLLTQTACMRVPVITYAVPLTSVERPVDVAARYGDYQLLPADSGVRYEDALLRLTALAAGGDFFLTVENRSPHSIVFVWEEAAYVNPDGNASSVVPGDTRCIDISARGAIPSQVIPRAASVTLSMIPRGQVYTSLSGGCAIRDFVTWADSTRFAELEGRTVRLILPFRVENTVNEYTLVFTMTGVGTVLSEPRLFGVP